MGQHAGRVVSLRRRMRATAAAVLLVIPGCFAPPDEAAKTPRPATRPAPARGPAAPAPPQAAATMRPAGGLPEEANKRQDGGSGGGSLIGAGGATADAGVLPRRRPPAIDEQRARRSGLRKRSSRHLTLYTDLPPSAAVDELPAAFDGAVPQWCQYFQIGADRAAAWHMTAYLMADKERFRQAGLLPDRLPPFLHGYQRDAEIWLYEQPADYYRRHLLLHEGTHAFMEWFVGACGPPWYREGVAELLATHRWEEGRATLGYFPRTREETPHWGRIKIIQDDLAAHRGKLPEEVMQYDHAAHLHVEPYAWCWAWAVFLDSDPFTRPKFRDLRRYTADGEERFNERFRGWLDAEWPRLLMQWKLFIYNLDYGYSLERERIEPRPARPLPAAGAEVAVAADRGWQSTGIRLAAGTTYRVEAWGRFQVADQPRTWWCEPNGVTLRYHRGLPLGILLGAIVDEEAPSCDITPLLRPDPLGLRREATAERSGTLYLRINDSPAALGDNAGSASVRITAVRPDRHPPPVPGDAPD